VSRRTAQNRIKPLRALAGAQAGAQ